MLKVFPMDELLVKRCCAHYQVDFVMISERGKTLVYEVCKA